MDFAAFFSNLSTLSILIFFAGFILIIIEMFQPGFGLFGILGIIVLIADIFITADSLFEGLFMTALILLLLLILFAIFIFLASRGRLPNKMILKDATNSEQGFSGAEDVQYLLGKSGRILTTCRPAGNADFDGVKLDVVSRGEYIAKGEAVEVVEVEGNRIVVTVKSAQ